MMILPELGTTLYSGAIGLLVIGIAGMVIAKNLFRILLALAIAEAGANLMLVLAGFRYNAVAPIISESGLPMVDPVPQAMVLTAIVIGVGIQALALSLILQIYKIYGTLDLREINRRLELDIAKQAGVSPLSSDESPSRDRPLPPLPSGIVVKPGVDA